MINWPFVTLFVICNFSIFFIQFFPLNKKKSFVTNFIYYKLTSFDRQEKGIVTDTFKVKCQIFDINMQKM